MVAAPGAKPAQPVPQPVLMTTRRHSALKLHLQVAVLLLRLVVVVVAQERGRPTRTIQARAPVSHLIAAVVALAVEELMREASVVIELAEDWIVSGYLWTVWISHP